MWSQTQRNLFVSMESKSWEFIGKIGSSKRLLKRWETRIRVLKRRLGFDLARVGWTRLSLVGSQLELNGRSKEEEGKRVFVWKIKYKYFFLFFREMSFFFVTGRRQVENEQERRGRREKGGLCLIRV